MRTIYYFRHGLPDFPGGVTLCLGPTPDLPLSAEGRAAAAAYADFFRRKRFPAVWSSPMRRCRETAAALTGGAIPIRLVPDLHELVYGAWEGLSFGEIRARFPELYARRATDMSLMPPGAEQVPDAARRGTEALRGILARTEGDVAVVAHAALGRAVTWAASGRPLEQIQAFQIDYLHVTMLRWDGERLSVHAVNLDAAALAGEI
jgi:broad specificity phosphatase PhoE